LTHFDQLHPTIQHHIVNSLGWRELRPFQEAAIAPILAGQHLIVLAPTAGGKTEAAFLPVISRMLSEGWNGLSVLYLCPIKALLNNLDMRLQQYCTLLGRRSALWHGDVTTSARRKILRDPPDVLLTTPESLEVMLVSPNVDARNLFSGLRAVIVDEIHAFAGDDRGRHLLSVLERVTRVAGRELQRIGLSATVGNPEMLVDWLANGCRGERRVLLPPNAATAPADVKLDFAGSLENAAIVISRLHRGEKRLVFIDSRARAEELGALLRQLGVTTFVTHSSLGQEQRRQAEDAFANRDDCVIVATSVLELGIDVGDLDRVIQIDSPPSASSFLQRMGRTGRRTGSTRNCLFLATRDEALLQSAGIIDLWETGYVEPTIPPAEPYHVLAQQLMALILQEGGIGRQTWFEWVDHVPAFSQMPAERIESVVQWMLEHAMLWDEEGILGIGRAGEEEYGRRHFMELLSVFLSPPLFTVLHGRQEIGFVDELTFLGKKEGPRVLLLGGRPWQVTHVDWSRKVAFVEATDERGRSHWKGEGRGLSFRLCQAIKAVVTSEDIRPFWSVRARKQIAQIRDDFNWLSPDAATTVLFNANGESAWWTFAGIGANASLAAALAAATQGRVSHESFSMTIEQHLRSSEIEQAIQHLRQRNVDELMPSIDERALQSLKFSDCLPKELALQILQKRLHDQMGVQHAIRETPRFVIAGSCIEN
jgi:ATP-dependent Lhr-like helicase